MQRFHGSKHPQEEIRGVVVARNLASLRSYLQLDLNPGQLQGPVLVPLRVH
jgi:hypothetical protein